MLRIVREVSPRFVFAENVQKKPIEQASKDLNTLGYKTKAIQLSAADHSRKRYWLLAHPDLCSEFLSTLDAEAPRMSELRCDVWKTGTDKFRMADGVADRVDRLRAVGNGQVPAVAALAWGLLTSTDPILVG
jgi:DNA (cytosine-5)-methyltransferase 1